jgi:outer membrane protein OmpA-like peptidoglycan-associated protein
VKGRVLDAKTKLPVAASIRYEDLDNRTVIGDCRSTPADGHYSMILPYGKNYGFYAQASGYIAVNENVNLKEGNTYNEIEQDIYLVPIELGQSISLNNVFFVRSKAELLPMSYPELDRLATLLKENPTIEIEIRGHTDNQGDPRLNVLLSEDRVKTVTEFLVKAGVDKSRIKGKGFGGAQPISPNNTEKNREKNRRVEFVIVKK